MEIVSQLLDVVLHLDTYLNDLSMQLGVWLYVVLFLIVFCETGLVVTPFLPGDSLLFAVGALAATNPNLHPGTLIVLLLVAAVAWDAVNYTIGYWIGPRVFRSESSWLLNKKHLLRTQRFYDRHGGKTIFLARFIPIIRTFAPFVAGVGRMEYSRFSFYNVTGGAVWVLTFLLGGYVFGNLEPVKKNFHIVIFAIIGISLVPVAVEFCLAMRRKQTAEPVAAKTE
jgi:membrane-associated protein